MSLEAHTVTAQAMDAGDRSEWSVVVIHGPDAATNGRTIPLQALVTGISRSRNSELPTIAIADPAISNARVTLHRVRDGVEIEDLGATNPVRVNGSRIRRAVLADQAVIRVGDTILLLCQRYSALQVDPFELGSATQNLLADLSMGQSAAALQLRVDLGFLELRPRVYLVSTPSPRACWLTTEWLRERWPGDATRIGADTSQSLSTATDAHPLDALIIERFDRVAPSRLDEWVSLLLERTKTAPVILTTPAPRIPGAPPGVDQLLAQTRGVELRVPRLLDRRADILPAILQRSGLSIEQAALPPSGIEQLLLHAWPDDIVELERCADRMRIAHRRGGDVAQAALPDTVTLTTPPPKAPSPVLTEQTVLSALIAYGGNVTAVAKHFGYSRPYFYRRAAAHHIDIKALRGVARERARADQ
jgi:hypothetical protein